VFCFCVGFVSVVSVLLIVGPGNFDLNFNLIQLLTDKARTSPAMQEKKIVTVIKGLLPRQHSG